MILPHGGVLEKKKTEREDQYNKKKKTGIVGIRITIIILVLLVFLSNLKLESFSYIENAFSAIVMPIQTGYTYLKNKIAGNSTFFVNMENLKTENENLANKNSELEKTVSELEIIKAENETLKEYLGLTQKYTSYKTVPAYIISKDVGNYSNIFVINAGKKDGIDINMTVIADTGLVGYVISVTDTTAKIETIIDPSSAVSASISDTEDSIICRGSLEKGMLKATYIPTNANISEGDSIETSGMGGIYPKGITIGKVKSIEKTLNKLDRYAWVEPAVDFEKLRTVLVILSSEM